MDAFQVRFSTALRAALEARIIDLTGLLVKTPAPDHSSYMERVGRIKGLQDALIEAHDIEARMDKPEGPRNGVAENSVRQTYEN
jgi:hypothetical protein